MKYLLNSKDIDAASNEAIKFLTDKHVASKDITRIRLGLEDTLLRYQEYFGEDTRFILKCTKFAGNIKVTIFVKGLMYDPYNKNEETDEENEFMRHAIFTNSDAPQWRYQKGYNVFCFEAARKSLPSWFNLALAIVLAIVCGLGLKAAPANVSNLVCAEIVAPLMDCFMNVIKAVASPLICLAVIWGMYSIGDATTFGIIGKKLTRRLMLYFNAILIMSGIVSIAMLPVKYGAGASSFAFDQIYKMILDIVPSDIVSPFSSGNTLQVFFLGLVIGLALLVAGERVRIVSAFVEELNMLVQMIMSYIGKFIPIFVFGSLLNIIVLNDFTQLSSTYMLVIINLITCLISLVALLAITGIKLKVSPLHIWKKMMPNVMLALSTGSSSAALSDVLSTCKTKFGVKDGFTNFGIPFAQIIFKPGTTMIYMTSSFFIASLAGIEISISWFVTALIVCVILGIASPPVAGGTLAAFTVLFAQMSLPIEYLAIIFTVGTLIDFFATATSVAEIQCQLLLAADGFDYIDREILES